MPWYKNLLRTLALLSSFSTLICCALPALLVALGTGAALAGLVSAFPQLVWISEQKTGVFILSGLLIAASGMANYVSGNTACPTEPEAALSCVKLRRFSFIMLWFSLLIYTIGFFFAFLAKYFT